MTTISIPAARFTEWQRSLVSPNRKREEESTAQRIKERQQVLVDAMVGGACALASYLRAELGLSDANLEGVSPLPRELSPSEAFEPPPELETELYDTWSALLPRDASQPAFWTVCHIRWLEEGTLGDDPCATFSTGIPGKRDSDSDTQTRDLLRHLGGIYVRGNVSVFSDCPLARAWWRRRLAVLAAEEAPHVLDVDTAHRALHRSRPVWEEITRLSVKRLTIINHSRARAAIIAHIASRPKIETNEVATIARGVARYGLEHSLHYVPWDNLQSAVRGS